MGSKNNNNKSKHYNYNEITMKMKKQFRVLFASKAIPSTLTIRHLVIASAPVKGKQNLDIHNFLNLHSLDVTLKFCNFLPLRTSTPS